MPQKPKQGTSLRKSLAQGLTERAIPEGNATNTLAPALHFF